MAPRVSKIRMLGSAAIDICHVACGRSDGYYEPGLYFWDVAAAGLIAKRAGAVISEWPRDAPEPSSASGRETKNTASAISAPPPQFMTKSKPPSKNTLQDKRE